MRTVFKIGLAMGVISLSGCVVIQAAGHIAYRDQAAKLCQDDTDKNSIHRRGCETFDDGLPAETDKNPKKKWKNRGED